jgi:hypothetical protein
MLLVKTDDPLDQEVAAFWHQVLLEDAVLEFTVCTSPEVVWRSFFIMFSSS